MLIGLTIFSKPIEIILILRMQFRKIMLKKIFVFIILIASVQNASAKLIFRSFDKKVKFTDYGREVEVVAKVRVDTPKRDVYYKEWTYIFDKRLKIEILKASIDEKSHKISFGNNELRFQFDKAFHNNFLTFRFKYKQYNDDTDRFGFIKEEFVSIPGFASEGMGGLEVYVPRDMEIYSMHSKFSKHGFEDKYTWKNKIPKEGFSDIFRMTLKKAKWRVSMKSTLINSKNFDNLEMQVPLYFKGGSHIIEDYIIQASDPEAAVTEQGNSVKVKFKNLKSRLAQVVITAVIDNGHEHNLWIHDLDSRQFSDIDLKTSSFLSEVLSEIKNQPNPDRDPEHVRIAKWVHNYLEYDESYIGREMTVRQILKEKRGVCSQYALLYEQLLRTAGIPATAISGITYATDKKEFQAHSWVLLYYNGEWIPIDPTWGIYSGKLPISHIFVYKDIKTPVHYTVFGMRNIGNIKTNISEEVEFLR